MNAEQQSVMPEPVHGQVWSHRDNHVLAHVLDVVPTRLVHTSLDWREMVVWRAMRMQGSPVISSVPIKSFLDEFIYVGEYDGDAERKGRQSYRVASASQRLAPEEVPDWDEYFLGVAQAASKRGKCSRRQVGACLVGPDHRILSLGYNGAPSGMVDCLEGGCPRGLRSYGEVAAASDYSTPGSPGFCSAIHAEVNATLHAGRQARGAVCYVTHEPCPDCTRTLAGAGVSRVVWPDGEAVPSQRLAAMAKTVKTHR